MAPEVDYRSFGFSAQAEPKVPFTRLHRHDEVEVSVNERYPVVAMFGSARVVLPANRLVVFWAVHPHGPVETHAGGWAYGVYVPVAWFLQWGLPEALVRPVLGGKVILGSPAPQAPVSDLKLLKDWVSLMQQGRDESRRIVLLEIEARLRRLAIELSDSPDAQAHLAASATTGTLNRFEQMAVLVAQHYREPLTTSDIAEAVGLHPASAMRLFHKASGMTLMAYLTQHRVGHAQRLLATTDRKMDDIAHDSGFGSIAPFYAAFRRATGQSPAAYRRALRSHMAKE